MTLKVDLEKQIAALQQVKAAYTDAIEKLHQHDLKRPSQKEYKGVSWGHAVADWRIGYETIANSILTRAGY